LIENSALTREFAENFLDFLVAFVALEIDLESHYGHLINQRDRLAREIFIQIDLKTVHGIQQQNGTV